MRPVQSASSSQCVDVCRLTAAVMHSGTTHQFTSLRLDTRISAVARLTFHSVFAYYKQSSSQITELETAWEQSSGHKIYAS